MPSPRSILKKRSKYSTSVSQGTRPSTVTTNRKRPTPTVAETSIRASSNGSGSGSYTESVSASGVDETQTVNSQKPSSSYRSSRPQSAFEKSISAQSNEENAQSNTSGKTTVVPAPHIRKTTQDKDKNITSKTKSTPAVILKKPNNEEKSGAVPKISITAAHGRNRKTEPPNPSRNNPETEFYQTARNAPPKIDNRKYQNQNQHQHEIPPHQPLAVTLVPPPQEKQGTARGEKPPGKKPAASRPMLLAKSTRRSSWTHHPSWAVKGHNVAPFGVPIPTRPKKIPAHVSQVGPLKDPLSTAVFAGGTAHSRVFPEPAQEATAEAKCMPINDSETSPSFRSQESAPIEFYLEPQQITTKSTFADSLPQRLSEPSSIKSPKSPPPVKKTVKSSQTPNDKSTMIAPPPVEELPKCQPIAETKMYAPPPPPIQPIFMSPQVVTPTPVQVECKIVQPLAAEQQQKQHPPKFHHYSTATTEASEASSSSSSKIQRIYIKDDHTQTKHHHFKIAEDQKAETQVPASIPEKPPFKPPMANKYQNQDQTQQNVLSKAISAQNEATETEEIIEQKRGAKAKYAPKNKPAYSSPYAKKKLMENTEKERAILEQKQEDVCQKCKLLQKKNGKGEGVTAGNPGTPGSCPVQACPGGNSDDQKTKICIIIDKGVVEKETIQKETQN